MAQNITLLGASYSDVPAVDLPKTGGGTARFADASVTTAVAEDVASGKVFLLADGSVGTGSASGGGGSDIPLLENTLTGAYRNDNVTTLRRYAYSYVTGITSIFLGELTTIQGADAFSYCSAQTIVLPKYGMGTWGGGTYVFRDARSTKTIDLSATAMISAYAFNNCVVLDTLILRSSTLEALNSTNVFNGSLFASGKSGGTLYVPQSLISSYQGASNWSTILGYANNQIKSIESTHTDPTAPIDLTLYYADGTPIS